MTRPDPAPDEAFRRLKERIIARTGHFYYQDKDAALWERLLRRFHATGARDAAAYLARLDDPAAGEAEWAALEAEITIGETFFFRYAEQFDALRDTILPELIAANRARRRLRVWSAGCATGAEPYSVAILLRRLLGEEIGAWSVSVLGTDINLAFLDAARRARYGAWALRAIPEAERARDFLPAADGRGWVLRPQHRALVRFERHNLLSLLDGTTPLQMAEFDLILCRNVLIYFHPGTIRRVVRALGERLSKGGWMLLGHAEPNPAFREHLAVVELPGTVAFRRPVPEPPAPAPPAAALPAPPPPPRPAASPPRPVRRPPA
ncbi:CheR family methyltransferase, partial [Crenalkalicoccus roseus]|uniref:CheR family methyltransferase n=1 Tax=Crenalkalicoccus roseus TaxID=1485588 RepID=UPI001F028E4E